ncbi:uncharacterized protein LOC121972495 [Zingiber officinale]|uniref:uncharacterized protein LOC121972495 n=1 Tax=Zingiber officinale TaxID=94328 RepID=UPI001C4AF37A|nr:uncharacterized protein LOC121972495 [Zingiber officinale]
MLVAAAVARYCRQEMFAVVITDWNPEEEDWAVDGRPAAMCGSSEGPLNKKGPWGKRGERSDFIGEVRKQVANRVGQGERRRVRVFRRSRARGSAFFPDLGFAMHSCEVLQMTVIVFLLELGKGSGIGMVIVDTKTE